MYALSRLPGATDRGIRNEMRQRRTRKRVGVASQRRGAWNDSERDEVLAAIVTNAHDLVGLSAGALEIRVLHVGGLANPMPGPQLGRRRRRHRGRALPAQVCGS